MLCHVIYMELAENVKICSNDIYSIYSTQEKFVKTMEKFQPYNFFNFENYKTLYYGLVLKSSQKSILNQSCPDYYMRGLFRILKRWYG